MSRFLKWAYSVGFFLAMCGLVAAGSYQYLDHLNIPYNINLFNCGTTSCTSMTLQNSGGTEIFTASNPGSVTLTNSSVTLSGSPVSVGVGDGSDATQGAKGDTAATNGFSTASVIALLKGILNNVVTPISVTGTINTTPAVSPQNVTVSNQATVNAVIASSPANVTVSNTASPAGVAVVNNVAVTTPTPLNVTVSGTPSVNNTPQGSPQNVTVSNSPVAVSIASSPVNITGNLSTTVNSPLGVTPFNGASPQNVTLSASPVSVAISTVSSPVNVTGSFSTTVNSPLGVTPFNGASPQNVTLSASPVSVAISTVSSPVNVTGSFSTTVNSPLGVTPFNGASPQNVTLSASPLGVAIAGPTPLSVIVGNTASPAGVAVVNNVAVTPPTPLQVTLPASPISVGIAGPTPLNVTIATGTNITQIAGNNIASPTGYGTAPVGSVQGVNAFVTNTVNATTTPAVSPQNVTLASTPLNVTIAGPTPIAVTLPSTPVLVAISSVSSPVNITGSITANSASPTNVNLDQINGQLIASPSTYGVAPVGSALGVNAFITNNVNVTPPTPLNVTLGTPLNVTIAGPTPLAVTLPSTPVLVAISTVSSPVNVTGSFSASVSSPLGVIPFNGASPQNVTIAGPTPLNVTIGGTPLNVTLAGPTPLNVTVGGIISPQNVTISGTPQNISLALPMPDACSYQAKTSTPFAVLATNTGFTPTQIVTGSVGQQVIICSLVVMAQVGAKVTIFEGVGQACQGAPIGNAKPIWGASPVASGLSLQANGGWVQGTGIGTVGQTTNASNSVCLLTSQVATSQYISGNISYVYK